jgi:hypothetical protein
MQMELNGDADELAYTHAIRDWLLARKGSSWKGDRTNFRKESCLHRCARGKEMGHGFSGRVR